MYLCTCICTVCLYNVCIVACYSDSEQLVRFGLVTKDSKSRSLWTWYAGNSKTSPQDDPRSRPVRVVLTRRWFGPKTTLFHASVQILSSLTFILILILPLNYNFWISYLMIVDTVLWSRLHISFSLSDYMTNNCILDIITCTISWSWYIALHILLASHYCSCTQQT